MNIPPTEHRPAPKCPGCDPAEGFCAECRAQVRRPCDLPPTGWRCTRDKGHDGPCACVATDEKVAEWFGVPVDALPGSQVDPSMALPHRRRMPDPPQSLFVTGTGTGTGQAYPNWTASTGSRPPPPETVAVAVAVAVAGAFANLRKAGARFVAAVLSTFRKGK